ncbi:protein AroM [Evansella caseinilytica]|uniref:Protein AroM n=1 Tax=Evansella caseinilytica TaxID=1503961 RepID=A0A1H3PDZ0_9BACI|nr:AroM family protein [Evansella caseinilytica]SDY99258.1 protein AroM [Evansella caseinilytica]
MMKKKIGLLTIGQSPRSDMTPEMQVLLGAETTFIEAGALDDLTEAEIARLAPDKGEATYVSRLRNGNSVKLAKRKVLPLLQGKVNEVEEIASSSVIVCTGSFPDISHKKPLLFPDQILKHVVKAVLREGNLGLLVPLAEQKQQLIEKWDALPVVAAAASPYEAGDFERPAQELKANGATIIVLDCMGYTEQHKKIVKAATGLPVILARSIVARIAAELG